MIVRALLAWVVAAVALSASGEGGAQEEGSRIEPLPGLETWDGMGDRALAGSSAEQDEAAGEEAAPADVGDSETENAAQEERAAEAAPALVDGESGGTGPPTAAAVGGAGSAAEEPGESAAAGVEPEEADPGAVPGRPAIPGLGDQRDAAAAEAGAGAGCGGFGFRCLPPEPRGGGRCRRCWGRCRPRP